MNKCHDGGYLAPHSIDRPKQMPTIERAIEIAAAAHAGQIDKAGQPYILHPLKVMFRVTDPHERMAAVLHDVVEDTSVTLQQLATEGFPAAVLSAIDALTKRPGETRIQAAARAALDPIALVVKLADNAENMDLSRIANPTEEDYARLKEYEEVRALLLGCNAA
jgi:(p)ppGpp synthase/HD superfamily hydrolase